LVFLFSLAKGATRRDSGPAYFRWPQALQMCSNRRQQKIEVWDGTAVFDN